MWLHSVADIQPDPVYRPDRAARASSQITLTTQDSSVRAELQRFIHRRYAEAYQADVSHFLPLLLTSSSAQDIQAVLGLRPGSSGSFFVEQYLTVPIEQAIKTASGRTVDRSRVIETGNLASLRGGSQRLFILLTELLYQAEFDWVCFTATPQVAALLHRLGFAPEILGQADPACLSDGGSSWGSYYHNKPMVLAGDVIKARQTLIRNELATHSLHESADELAAAVQVLTSYSRGAGQQEDAAGG